MSALPTPAAAPPTRVGRWVLAALAAFAALVIGLALFVSLNRPADPPAEPSSASAVPPGRPVIVVGSFANLSGSDNLAALGEQLAERVTVMLGRFDDFETRAGDADSAAERVPAAYAVGGVISPGPAGPEVTSLVSSGPDTLWRLVSRFDTADPDAAAIEDMASRIVAAIAPLRGPIYDRARAWLDEQQRPLPAVSPFVCLLTYRLARESGSSLRLSDALECHGRLLDAEPDNAIALASRAFLQMRVRLNQMRPRDDVRAALEASVAEALRARSLAPDSSFVNGELGLIYNWRNEFAESRRAFTTALELNPLNTDARAGYAIALARGVDWTLGVEQAARAIADSPQPPAWYYYPAAVNAWRAGRLEDALQFALRAAQYGEGEAGTLIALAAAVMLGREEVIDELRPRVLGMERLRLWGIKPWLRAQVIEDEVADSVAEALRRAGISEDALTGQF